MKLVVPKDKDDNDSLNNKDNLSIDSSEYKNFET